MRTEELANYIEKLRYGRNISQEIFLDEIISLRQYQRYRNGQSIMPIEILEKMSTKLGIPLNKLLSEFELDKNIEAKKVATFYNSVIGGELESAKGVLSDFLDYVFIDDEKALLFSSARFLLDYKTSKISQVELVKYQADLISYPDILKNEIMTDAELLILGIIMEYSPTEQDQITEKLSNFLNNTNLIISENKVYPYSQVFYWISKYYGKKHRYSEVIHFCDMGIELNLENKTIYLLENFYYYKALVYFRTKKQSQFENSLYNCLLLLEGDMNEGKRKYFYEIIMKDLKINPYDFLIRSFEKKKVQHFE